MGFMPDGSSPVGGLALCGSQNKDQF